MAQAASERPRVFISYSHDSEEHRGRVLALAERLRQDGIDAQVDRYVNGAPEEHWTVWMRRQIHEADFVIMVCTETYFRRFWNNEKPGTGNGVGWEGALIRQELYEAKASTLKFVPVTIGTDSEEFVPEILRGRTYALVIESAYERLYRYLRGVDNVHAGPLGPLRPLEPITGTAATFGTAGASEAGRKRRIAVSRLPRFADTLFGREAELKLLEEAWGTPKIHVVTVVAWGGMGKTSLVAKWTADLAARDFDGADYFDWSFYSQGTRDQGGASADAFIDAALRFFGDAELADRPASPWDKGARLAQLVAERRTLLVLDGLEPLQHPPGPMAGELKDPAVGALLKGLAQRNAGLCVVTTRESVRDLARFRGSTAQEWTLDRLSTEAGVALLSALEVNGNPADLHKLVDDVAGHALTIDLLGRYLAKAHGGDVRRRDRVQLDAADARIGGGHAGRAMDAYQVWLSSSGDNGRRQLSILRLMGLFDRPASAVCLQALRREPPIPGLTEPLVGIDEDDWNLAVCELEEVRLLARDGSSLDAHPLIREHLARRLREEHPEAWKAAHARLFDHLKDSTEPFPDTLDGLQPLYQAVVHGCHAARTQEACDAVYFGRICRENEAYSVKKLGAFSTEVGAVACFFNKPWSVVSQRLTPADQSWVLAVAGFSLRGLGRLTEALEPIRESLRRDIGREDWKNAAISANNLGELELTLGKLSEAVRDAKQSVEFADRSGDEFERMDDRAALADALHQSGRRDEALVLFHDAEALQAQRTPKRPLLNSLANTRYCDLLLAEAERAAVSGSSRANLSPRCGEVEHRSSQALALASRNDSLLHIGLAYLTLGRARLYHAVLEETSPEASRDDIERCVDGLRRAGRQDFVPHGLLTRAWLRSLTGDSAGARADLDEAQEIAERGPMPLHLADVNLYRARLFHDRVALAEARRLIDKHGYGRRRGELEDLESAVKGWDSGSSGEAEAASSP